MAFVQEKRVHEYLDSLGLSHATIGYQYLLYSILLVCNNPSLRNARRITPVYQMVASTYGTTVNTVEHRIRNLLRPMPNRKTNSKFIFWASDHLSSED